MPLTDFMEEALKRALQKAMYWHQIDVQREPRRRIENDAGLLFAEQAYDVLLAYFQADLSEAPREDEDDRKVAIIIAAIAAALLARKRRDVGLLRPGLEQALRVGANFGGLARYGITTDLQAIRAEQYLLEHGGELIKDLNDFTVKELRQTLARSVREGASIEDTASRLMTKMDDMRWYRAKRIAITESSKAWSYAELEAADVMEKAGFNMVKEWLLGPAHPRYDICDHNHEEGAIPLKQLFSSGDMAPPQHPNCGCSLITYPAGGDQPWGSQVLGQMPYMPFGFDTGDKNADR